jgi:PRTRC genetic system protein B
MKVHVEIGEACQLELQHAVLVYRSPHRAFATLHDISKPKDGAPLLGPARPLSLTFLRRLAEGLGSQVSAEILPVNVLARTPETLVWWSPASRRIMFFGETDQEARKLNGMLFPHPSLVFKVRGRELFVRALAKNGRPLAPARLMTAPYWNVAGDDGRVCLGTARAPAEASVASIPAWESAFHKSEFTHALGAARLTTHAGGFVGLWRHLAGKKRFPARYLVEAKETLAEFVVPER